MVFVYLSFLLYFVLFLCFYMFFFCVFFINQLYFLYFHQMSTFFSFLVLALSFLYSVKRNTANVNILFSKTCNYSFRFFSILYLIGVESAIFKINRHRTRQHCHRSLSVKIVQTTFDFRQIKLSIH